MALRGQETILPRPILLLVDEVPFASQLARRVQEAGYEPCFVTDEPSLSRAMVRAPAMALVDLAAVAFSWERLVRQIRGPHKTNPQLPVLGFGPHTDPVRRRAALAAGCAAVVSRAAVMRNLPALIEKYTWTVDPAWRDEPLPPLVQAGIEAFNRGAFYHCHELLEDAWNAERRPLRILYQGILQIGVGYFHITRHNWRGAVKVLERGIPKAAHFRPVCQGIDVEDLVAQAQAIHAEITALGPERIAHFDPARFPPIRLLP